MRIAASPGSILQLPSSSYRQTRSKQFVHIAITTKNWNMFNHAPIVAAAWGIGRFNMTNNFNAAALISVTLFRAAKQKINGNAQANIMIIPNCRVSSRKSSNKPSSSSSPMLAV
uniref:Uncharacterized protein n=1 Tax=Arundo donax TaxID=35708 RepID=A0A0A9CNB1_ARUDO